MGDVIYIASVVATYWVVSISMVYLNKVRVMISSKFDAVFSILLWEKEANVFLYLDRME